MHLEIYDWGGSGPATLLAHPTGFNGRVWAPVATGLVEAGRHVWSFDFRGHGASDRDPTLEYDWHGFVADASAVTDTLGLAGDPDLLVAGHSMGGAALLGAEVARPGLFPRIWAFEPIVPPVDERFVWPADNPMSNGARRRRDVWESREEAFATYASKPPLDVFTEEALRGYVWTGLRELEDGGFELACRPEDEAQVYATSPGAGVYVHLGEIRCPVRVVRGAATPGTPALFAPAVVERVTHGELEEMDDLGHFGPAEDPPRIVASMLDFVAQTST